MMKENFDSSWKALAKYSRISERALYRLRNKLEEAEVIDYPLKGFPPRRVMHWNKELFDEFIGKYNKNKRKK